MDDLEQALSTFMEAGRALARASAAVAPRVSSDPCDPPVSVVVAHEDALPREIIARACAGRQMAVVGRCASTGRLIERCAAVEPDVVVTSDTLGTSLDELLDKVLACGSRVMVISAHASADFLIHLLSRGVHGYLLYDTSPNEIAAGVQAVAREMITVDPSLADLLVQQWTRLQSDDGPGGSRVARSLTPREHDVLVAMAEGLPTKAIARRLGVAFKTVENHKLRVFEKLRVRTHAEAVSVAIGYGLVPQADTESAPTAHSRGA